MVKSLWRGIFVIALSLFVSGCGAKPSIVELEKNKPVVQNPINSSKKIMIGNVVDNRKFQIKPASLSTPSLINAQQHTSKSITSRAVGMKLSYSGDLLLPKGQTVELTTRRIVEDAFKRRGYNVVHVKSANVTQVDISIEKFWFWAEKAFWAFPLQFQSDLILSSNGRVLTKNPIHVKSDIKMHTQTGGVVGKYVGTIDKALLKLEKNIQKVIVPVK